MNEAAQTTNTYPPQSSTWRWRTIQCVGAFLTVASLILGFLPWHHPVALSASAGNSLYVLNYTGAEVLRYDGNTGAFRNSVTPKVGAYPAPGGPRLRYGAIYGMTIGPDQKLYAITFGGLTPTQFTWHILRFEPTTGALIDSFMSNDDQPLNGQIRYAHAIAFGPDGNLYVSDLNRVLRYNGKTGAFMSLAASDPAGSPPLGASEFYVIGLAFGPDGKLYVDNILYDNHACCASYTRRILRYDPATGKLLNVFVKALPGVNFTAFNSSSGITFGPDGNLYINVNTNQVLRYNGSTGAAMGVFIDHASAYPDPNDPGTPTTGGLAFGPDGNLYVASHYNNQIRRYDGTTGAFIDVFINGGRLGLPTYLLFANTGSAGGPAQAVRAAQVALAQQTQPRLQAAPGDLVITTLVARNRGKGSAKTVTLTMPFDPAAVAVVDATFSRPSDWVSQALSSTLTIQLGALSSGESVTATVRLRVLPTASPGAHLAQLLAFRWTDLAGGGAGASNRPALLVGDSVVDAPFGALSVAPASGPAGTTHTFQANTFVPGEPVSLWYNTPDGRAVAVGQVLADRAGAIRVEFATAGLPPGSYSMVAYGTWSADTSLAPWRIEAARG